MLWHEILEAEAEVNLVASVDGDLSRTDSLMCVSAERGMITTKSFFVEATDGLFGARQIHMRVGAKVHALEIQTWAI